MKRTQRDMLLTMLRLAGSTGITAAEAYEMAGCLRLAARIHDLRREGFDIEAHTLRLGNGKAVARYVLRERPVQLVMGVAS